MTKQKKWPYTPEGKSKIKLYTPASFFEPGDLPDTDINIEALKKEERYCDEK